MMLMRMTTIMRMTVMVTMTMMAMAVGMPKQGKRRCRTIASIANSKKTSKPERKRATTTGSYYGYLPDMTLKELHHDIQPYLSAPTGGYEQATTISK